MKIALAQIDMRLGDIDAITDRVLAQAELALEQGASILCTPAALYTSTLPGMLIAARDFEHDLLASLTSMAEALAGRDLICLVPSAVMYGDQALFELFMLKHGRVVPCRSATAIARDMHGADLWAPPVFDVAGVRIAATFEAARDLPELPAGVDLMVYFQVASFNASDSTTCGIAGLADSGLAELVRSKSLFFAQMAPVGAYDDSVYVGGSYVLDDSGRVVAAAPCFEEALLVQEISRGVEQPAVDEAQLPRFSRDDYLWRALVSSLRATARARGQRHAVVLLEGTLASCITAALCVAAFGPRNVFAISMNASGTGALAEDDERAALVRQAAEGLGIQLIEREDASIALAGEGAMGHSAALRTRICGLYLQEAAEALDALVVSSLTKTDYALAASKLTGAYMGDVAPFGDVYFSQLEFLALARNRVSFCVPAVLASLSSVERDMARIVELALASFKADEPRMDRLRALLEPLDPSDIDAVLEAHVDKNLCFDDIPLAQSRPEAVALLLMCVRKAEAARRMLPPYPLASPRSFAERMWPRTLAWSDMGRRGADELSVEALARAEVARHMEEGQAQSARMRGEFMDMLGDLLGFTPEQLDELRSDEGQERIRENLDRFQSQVEDVINEMLKNQGDNPPQGPQVPGQGFFSSN